MVYSYIAFYRYITPPVLCVKQNIGLRTLTIVNFPETHFLKNALCAKYLTDDFSRPLCAAQSLFPPVSPADPASAIVTRLMQAKLWNAPMNEKPTAIPIAPCIAEQCPSKEELVKKITAKAGIKVIEGTHPYAPPDIFA